MIDLTIKLPQSTNLWLGAIIFSNAYFGRGTGPILLDDLLCTGSEARLVDCPRYTSQGIGTYDFCFGHYDDAGVRCMQCESTMHSVNCNKYNDDKMRHNLLSESHPISMLYQMWSVFKIVSQTHSACPAYLPAQGIFGCASMPLERKHVWEPKTDRECTCTKLSKYIRNIYLLSHFSLHWWRYQAGWRNSATWGTCRSLSKQKMGNSMWWFLGSCGCQCGLQTAWILWT